MKLVADNLQIIRQEIGQALDTRNPDPVRQMVQDCIEAGADGIDINSGPLSREPEEKMTFLVKTLRSVTDRLCLIDTTNPAAMRAGLLAAGENAIINGISLEPAKLEQILPLAEEFHVPVIGYLLDEKSRVPATEPECYDISVALLQAVESAGVEKENLIIDPVVAPLMWDSGIQHNRHILSVIRNLPDVLGFPVKTIAGLSNLTTGRGPAAKKRLMEAAFLPMLADAGLGMLLLNIFHTDTTRLARSAPLLTEPGLFSWASVPD
jgi:5-methyltetrahydrofolate corrinoid/iron sulfur protein methyltransferase